MKDQKVAPLDDDAPTAATTKTDLPVITDAPAYGDPAASHGTPPADPPPGKQACRH